MCEFNKEENKLLGFDENEECSLEDKGIKCRYETMCSCYKAENALSEPFLIITEKDIEQNVIKNIKAE